MSAPGCNRDTAAILARVWVCLWKEGGGVAIFVQKSDFRIQR